jgi:uncharacterized membrane protein YhhN
MSVALLSGLGLVCALLTIRAANRGPRWQVYVFKPMTTLAILLIAVAVPPSPESHYQVLIIAGLFCSLIGDVFLMLPGDRFVPGLASFLAAHLWYIGAFATVPRSRTSAVLLFGLAFVGAGVLRSIWAGLERHRWPVVAYVAVIVAMAWLACVRWHATGETGAALAAGGALVFLVSDSALAVGRFRKAFRNERAWVLGTYFLAQWLIALSVTRGVR